MYPDYSALRRRSIILIHESISLYPGCMSKTTKLTVVFVSHIVEDVFSE